MIRFRFIVYLNEIDEVVSVNSSLNYFMEFSIFGKKTRYKLDTSRGHKNIPLKKLKVIYFFANSLEKAEEYAKTAGNFRINILTETKEPLQF